MVTLRLEVAQPGKIRLGDDQGLLTGNNGKLALDFLKNDTIPAGSDLKISIAVQPRAGSADIKDQKLIYNLTSGGFTGTDSFAYRICLSACPEVCDQAWVHVFVPDDLSKYNTNVLTPDVADGINDVFDAVTGLEAQNYRVSSATLRIYSQWGMLVYRETSERPQWNGKTNGKTVPQGTYYYEIKASVGAAEPVTVVGTLTVLE
jgi:gliding motility-associated-like protein